jgi:hypothetical protein
MRPVIQRLAAPGNTQWIPLNYLQAPFNVGVWFLPGVAAAFTGNAQISGDDAIENQHSVAISRVGALATVVDPAHGLVTGDSIIVSGGGAPFDTVGVGTGAADITQLDANSYTYAVVNAGPLTANVNVRLGFYRVFDLAALTVRAVLTELIPAQAIRLQGDTLAGGTVDFIVLQGGGDR